MSLDIRLTVSIEVGVVDKNITHNLIRMWKEAGVYNGLYESNGMTAKDVLPTLEIGLQQLLAEPERFKQFDSPNGWGTYKNAVTWLEELIEEFKKYPNGIISIDR